MKTLTIKEARVEMQKLWDRAKASEEERKTLLAELQSHPLWKRIFLFTRYSDLRARIKGAEWTRSLLVMAALGMSRTIRRIEQKVKRESRN
jgi:hypothetical protein